MKTILLKVLLCSIFLGLILTRQANAQIKTLLVAGAPSPPGPVSGPTNIVLPSGSSQYTVPPILPGITLNWSLSPSTAGSISAYINQAAVICNSLI